MYDYPDSVIKLSWMYMHDRKRDLLWQTHIITEVYFFVVLPNALLYSYELNTLDACWIAVDVWGNSSRCRQESVYLSRTWCLHTWSCLDILIIIRFSINCTTIIRLPIVILMLLREATSETYGPGSIFYLINVPSTSYFLRHLFCFLYF